jgi:hypothetical protein
MTDDDKDRSGYYQSIARAFLERRGAPLLLSPRDQALIGSWEARRIPLRVVLEAIARTFDDLRSTRRVTRGISLGRCERRVDEAFAQHRDRGAGGRATAGTGPGKPERARREIEKALRGLPPEDGEMAGLLRSALTALDGPARRGRPRKIDADVEELLWSGRRRGKDAAASGRRELRGRPRRPRAAASVSSPPRGPPHPPRLPVLSLRPT